jgi:hypothetical protein
MSTYVQTPISSLDYGYQYIFSNSLSGNLQSAVEMAVTYTIDEIKDTDKDILLLTYIFFAATMAVILFTVIVLIRPTINYTVKAKHDVLSIFLAVPSSFRREFRRSAAGIYQIVASQYDSRSEYDDDEDLPASSVGTAVHSTFTSISHLAGDRDHGRTKAQPASYRYFSARTARSDIARSDIARSDIESHRPEPSVAISLAHAQAADIETNTVQKSPSMSLRGPMVRPLFFLLTMASFFIVTIFVTMNICAKIEQAAVNVAVANLRNPRYQNSLSFAVQNIVTSKAVLAAVNPNDPLLLGPEFYDGSSQSLLEGRAASFAVMFGGSMNITSPLNDDLQNELMFKSVCEFPKDKAYELMPELADQPQLFRDCALIDNADLGLYGMISAFDEMLAPLTTARYSNGVSDVFTGVPGGSQLTYEEAINAALTFSKVRFYFVVLILLPSSLT